MSLTNAQAALLAAASQTDMAKSHQIEDRLVDGAVATRLIAAAYVTWLDQQDELAARLLTEDPS